MNLLVLIWFLFLFSIPGCANLFLCISMKAKKLQVKFSTAQRLKISAASQFRGESKGVIEMNEKTTSFFANSMFLKTYVPFRSFQGILRTQSKGF